MQMKMEHKVNQRQHQGKYSVYELHCNFIVVCLSVADTLPMSRVIDERIISKSIYFKSKLRIVNI